MQKSPPINQLDSASKTLILRYIPLSSAIKRFLFWWPWHAMAMARCVWHWPHGDLRQGPWCQLWHPEIPAMPRPCRTSPSCIETSDVHGMYINMYINMIIYQRIYYIYMKFIFNKNMWENVGITLWHPPAYKSLKANQTQANQKNMFGCLPKVKSWPYYHNSIYYHPQ